MSGQPEVGDIIEGGPWDGFELISKYTRAQAIEDGFLDQVTDLVPDEPLFAEQAGFRCHVALTPSVTALVIPTEREKFEQGQDLKGRLWDVLSMARMYKRGITDEGGEWFFPCIFALSDRPEWTKRKCSKTLKLKCVLAGGDNGEPVVTIMLPRED